MASQRTDQLKRLKTFGRLLDSSIPLPGGYRIGLDGIFGLIPGFGDVAGGVASSYIILEAARLGASTTTLLHMVFNVLIDSLIGLIPILGDLFDFVWKANNKNIKLLIKHLDSPRPKSSPEHRLTTTMVIILIILVAGTIGLAYLGFMLLLRLIAALQASGG